MKKSPINLVAKQTTLDKSKAFTNKYRPEFVLDVVIDICTDCIFPHPKPMSVLLINWYDDENIIKETIGVPFKSMEEFEAYASDMRDNHRAAFKALVRFAIDTMSDHDADLDVRDVIFDVCNESERLAIWLKEVLTEKY